MVDDFVQTFVKIVLIEQTILVGYFMQMSFILSNNDEEMIQDTLTSDLWNDLREAHFMFDKMLVRMLRQNQQNQKNQNRNCHYAPPILLEKVFTVVVV